MPTRLKHVLLIDDDEDSREVMYVWLGREGIVLTEARTIHEGLRLVKRHYFDLYVLGGSTPDGEGKSLCQRVHEIDPRIPIIIYSNQDRDLNARDRNVQAYLRKPDDLPELGPTIIRLTEAYVRSRAVAAGSPQI